MSFSRLAFRLKWSSPKGKATPTAPPIRPPGHHQQPGAGQPQRERETSGKKQESPGVLGNAGLLQETH